MLQLILNNLWITVMSKLRKIMSLNVLITSDMFIPQIDFFCHVHSIGDHPNVLIIHLFKFSL